MGFPPGPRPGPERETEDSMRKHTLCLAWCLLLCIVECTAEARTDTDAGESRTPIKSLPFSITNSGSYFLVTNLTGTGGITVMTNDVSIDLKGFSLVGANSTNSGIYTPFAASNLVVLNGSIHGWNGHGLYAENVKGCRAEHLVISDSAFSGFRLGDDSRVIECNAHDNGQNGISAGDKAFLENCEVRNNRSDGIHVSASSKVAGCWSLENRGIGIIIGKASTVRDCVVERNSESGIYVAQADCVVTGNNCYSNNLRSFYSDAGIYVFDNHNRIEENHVTGNGNAGISVFTNCTGNVIAKNSVSDNGPNNYFVPPGNELHIAETGTNSTTTWLNTSH